MSLKKRYRESIQPKLKKDLSLNNIHEVPKVLKVTVNRGLGEAAANAKSLEASVNELAQITGQKVVITRAKKAIAGGGQLEDVVNVPARTDLMRGRFEKGYAERISDLVSETSKQIDASMEAN